MPFLPGFRPLRPDKMNRKGPLLPFAKRTLSAPPFCVLKGCTSATARASMTVEAALVLPVFIFFLSNILYSFEILRFQCNMKAALHDTGTQICEYAMNGSERREKTRTRQPLFYPRRMCLPESNLTWEVLISGKARFPAEAGGFHSSGRRYYQKMIMYV